MIPQQEKNIMLIPIFTLFIFLSVIWLVIGIRGRKEIAILILNLFWWLGSFVSAYFTWLVWQDRRFSENWAMIGFMLYAIPYIVSSGTLVSIELYLIRKWSGEKTNTIKLSSVSLLIFLVFQLLTGFLSA